MTTPQSTTRSDPEGTHFLRTADVEAVLERMAARSFLPNLEDAVAVRDRAATLLTGDPTLAARLATGLGDAVDRHRSDADPRIQAVALRCRAESCLFLGRVQEAHRLYGQAAGQADRTDDPELLGQILVGMVGVLGVMGNTNASHPVARRAQRLLERAGDDVYLGKLFMNLGNAAYNGEHYAPISRM
jgi:hypothetical protein